MKKFCILFLGAIMAITMILPAQKLPGESNSAQKTRYTDGTYIGTGRGFRPGLKVKWISGMVRLSGLKSSAITKSDPDSGDGR